MSLGKKTQKQKHVTLQFRHTSTRWQQNSISSGSPIFLAPGTGFREDNVSMDGGVGGVGFGRIIQVCCIHCALYFCHYITSTSDCQALEREVGDPCHRGSKLVGIFENNGLLIYTLELWCWRRLLRVPWTARRSNQSILKDISPGCSLEALMLKLKLQCFGHQM